MVSFSEEIVKGKNAIIIHFLTRFDKDRTHKIGQLCRYLAKWD